MSELENLHSSPVNLVILGAVLWEHLRQHYLLCPLSIGTFRPRTVCTISVASRVHADPRTPSLCFLCTPTLTYPLQLCLCFFFTEGWAAPECKRTSPLGRALVFPRIQCTKHLLHHQHHQHYLTRHGQDFPVLHHSSRSCRPRWKDRSQHTSPTATDTLESGPNEPKMYTRLGTALWRKEVF